MQSTNNEQAVENLVFVPLNELRISPLNQRVNDTSDVSELRALIRSQGLLQNLIVMVEQDGSWGVIAGGRRLRSLQLEAQDGYLESDYPVPCRVALESEAVGVSIAENSGRAPMHPADEFRAFKRLFDDGLPIEDIAGQFGVSPAVVRRRMALADVAPEIVDAYRAGKLTLETLQLFTLAPSRKAQMKVWKETPEHNRNPYWIRQAFTKGKTSAAESRECQFVGLAAYEAAGGAVVRDLFGGPESGYIEDMTLMRTLAAGKLEAEAAKLRAQGWAFVEVHNELGWQVMDKFTRSKPTTRELTETEQAEISTLEAALEAKNEELHADPDEEVEALTDGETEAIEHDIGVMQARITEIRESTHTWSDRQKAKAGAVLGLAYGGLEIHRGMLRKADAKEQKKKELAKAQKAAEAAGEPVPMGLSDALTRKLTANRSAALAAHLLECPRVAIDLLCAQLATQVIYSGGYYGSAGVHVQPHSQMAALLGAGDDVEESRAYKVIDEQRDALLELLPENPAELFAWLGEQNIMTVVEILCFCTAATLNATVGNEHTKPLEQLEGTIGLNMADWWQPTRDSFLNQVPKDVIVGALKDVGFEGEQLAKAEKLKKGALAEFAEGALKDTGWLPSPLRSKTSPIVAEARKPKAAASEAKAPQSETEAAPSATKAPKNATRGRKPGAKAPKSESPAEQFNRLHPAAAWPFPTGVAN